VNDTGDMQDWTAPDDDVVPPDPPPRRRRRRFRPLVWALEAVGAAVGAILLIGVLLASRLEFGPIEVDFLTPALVDFLNVEARPLHVQIERTSLSWSEGRTTIDVIGSGLRVAGPSGSEIVSIPKLSLSVSLRALMTGRFAISRMVAAGPEIRLVRASSGEFGIDLGAGATSPESALAEMPPLRELWDAFASAHADDRTLSYLDRLAITQSDLVLDDQQAGLSWHVGAGEISIMRRPDGLDARLAATVGLGSGETRLSGRLNYMRPGKRLGFFLDWGRFDLSRLAAVLPVPYAMQAARLRLPVAGQAEGEIGLADKALGALHLRLDAGAGMIADPYFIEGRLDLAGLTLDADYRPADHRLKLGMLLDLNGPSVDLSGTVDHLPADPLAALSGDRSPAMTASMAVLVHALPIDRLGTLWPGGLAVHTRDWITTNLSAGSIEDLHSNLTLTIAPGADPPIDVADFAGTITVKGANVVYMAGLPRVEGVDAAITLGSRRLGFDVTSGHLKGLAIPQGTIVIDDFDAPVERATIDLALTGPAQDVMTVLDAKRLQYAHALGIDPREVAGAVDGRLHFRFPLKSNLSVGEIDYGATAQLTDLALGHAALSRDLTEGNFALTLDRTSLTLDGKARLDGLAGTIDLKRRLSGTAGRRAETHVKTWFDEAARKRFGLDLLPDNLHGPVGTDLIYAELDDHRTQATVALDLAAATLSVDEAGWQKPAGQPAHADFTVEFIDGHPNRLKDLVLRGPRLEIRGALGFGADGRLTDVVAPKFRLGETDAALTLGHGDTVWRVGLRGPVVDLGTLLKRFKDQPAAEHPDAGPTVDLDVQTEQLVLGPNRTLRNAQLAASVAERGLARAKITASLAGGGKLEFRMDPVDAGGAFNLTTDDFGALLRVADVSGDVVGGHLVVSGRAVREGNGRRFSGHAEGENYRFTGAPFMVRLLSVASLSSIQTMLNGDGIPFTALKGDLSLHDGKLGLSHARAFGGALAVNVERGDFDFAAGHVDLDGTLVPAYTLNGALGNVPILGDLLLGGEGQGLFAANFRMSGPIDHPAIAVNPLSTFAPGFLRRMFLFDAPGPVRDDQKK
jgi:Protein of unknown function/AsmA-like C-terminal region